MHAWIDGDEKRREEKRREKGNAREVERER